MYVLTWPLKKPKFASFLGGGGNEVKRLKAVSSSVLPGSRSALRSVDDKFQWRILSTDLNILLSNFCWISIILVAYFDQMFGI
jgi:hypothetical protein